MRVGIVWQCGGKLVVVAKLRVHVPGGSRKIAADIAKVVLKDVQNSLAVSKAPITIGVRKIIAKRLLNSSVVRELERGGQLYGELGVPDAHARVTNIIRVWLRGIEVKFTPLKLAGTRISGGLKITAVDASFKDVLSQGDATFVTAKSTSLPWLEWLLMEGSNSIIKDYTVGVHPTRSRTGRLVMVKTSASSWSVPPEFSGTMNNNFVTRAMDGAEEEIDKLLSREINKRLK